jgi:enoyl-CoA hydratase/carnithine racemase
VAEFVSVEDVDNVAVIRIDRPKVNALSLKVLDELAVTFSDLRESPARAMMLWGGDTVFSAGADVDELGTPEQGGQMSDAFRRATLLINATSRVVVVGIAGFCLGGGLEIALCGDFRVAARTAQLGTPEVKLGLVPGGGATARLPHFVGEQRARKLLFTGDSVDAVTAEAWGLVDRVVDDHDVYEQTLAWAKEFADGPTTAHKHLKNIIQRYRTFGLDGALSAEQAAFIDIFRSSDAAEGLRAFREKGSPNFSGN